MKGKYSLCIKKFCKLNELHFNARFNIGSRGYSIIHLEKLVVLKDGDLYELANKAKRNDDLFGNDMAQVKRISLEISIDNKLLADLVILF